MPKNVTIFSCNTAKLNMPTLIEQARKGHVSEALNNNLLSAGKLCDAGYHVNLEKHKATVHENDSIIITAKHDHSNRFLCAPLMDHTLKQNNVQ
jgi:hypothetical protein